MTARKSISLTLAAAGCALLLQPVTAQGKGQNAGTVPPHFAAPKRIEAGQEFLGKGRYYPSPVMHDVNGDGRLDIVVGDLLGRVTVALREDDGTDKVIRFGAEKPLKDRSGEQLKFHNW